MGKGRWWLAGSAVAGGLVASTVAGRKRAFLAQHARNAGIRVLVVGAGVVGSTYAEHLARWGMQVSLLARGARLQELMDEGLWVRDVLTRRRHTAQVRLVTEVRPDERYDLVLVAVRYTQAEEALALVKPLAPTMPILLLQNNPRGAEPLLGWLDGGHLLMGFPATGGLRTAGEVLSLPLWVGPTILGDPRGTETPTLQQAVSILRRAGLSVQTQQIEPWLRTHATMIAVLAGCAYKNGGHIRRMAGSIAEARFYLAAMREAYGVLRANGVPITPRANLTIYRRPVWMQTVVVSAAAWAPWAPLLVDAHFAAAPEEMRALYDVLMALAQRAILEVPLLASLEQYFPTKD